MTCQRFATGRGLYPRLVDGQSVHLWTCDETGALDTLYDAMNGDDIGVTGTGISSVSQSPVGRARRMGSGSGYGIGSNNGDDTAAIVADGISVEMLIRLGNPLHSSGTRWMFGYGNTGETEANNELCAIGITSTGNVVVNWEYSTGVDSLYTFTKAALKPGEWYVVGIRANPNGANWEPELFINGTSVEKDATGRTKPSGGTTAVYTLWGDADSLGAPPAVAFAFVHVATGSLDDDHFADTARRAYGLWGHNKIHARVEVEDVNGTMQDLTDYKGHDWVVEVALNNAIDGQSKMAEVDLISNINRLNLAWADEASRANQSNDVGTGSYGPLLQPSRDADVYLAQVPLFLEPEATDWTQFLAGTLEDISPDGQSRIKLQIHDKLERADVVDWIGAPTIVAAGDDTIEGTIDEIWSNWSSLTKSIEYYFLPNFTIEEYEQQPMSVWDAQQAVAMAQGSFIRSRFDHNSGFFDQFLDQPDPEGLDVDVTFTDADIFTSRGAQLNRDRVRNKITGTCPDSGNLDANNQPQPTKVTVEDSGVGSSQEKYGVQEMFVTEDATSRIDTSAELTSFLNLMLDNLKEPYAFVNVTTKPVPGIEPAGIVGIGPLVPQFTTRQALSPARVRTLISKEKSRTELQLRGTPSFGYHTLLSMEARPGGAPAPNFTSPVVVDSIGTDWGLALANNIGGFTLSAERPFSKSRWEEFEVHAKKGSADFTPGASTILGRMKTSTMKFDGLDPDSVYRVRVIPVDGSNNRGTSIDLSTAQPLYTAAESSSKRPNVLAYVSSSWTLGATGTEAVRFNTEINDDGNNFLNSGSYYFTTPFSGIYEIFASLLLNGTGWIAYLNIEYSINLSSWFTLAQGTIVAPAPWPSSQNLANVYWRGNLTPAANNYVRVTVNWNTGGTKPTIGVGASQSLLSIYLHKDLR